MVGFLKNSNPVLNKEDGKIRPSWMVQESPKKVNENNVGGNLIWKK